MLLKIKLISILRNIFKNDFKSIIKIISYIFVITSFLLGIYFLFYNIFSFLIKYEEIGYGLIYRIFSLMLLMFFIMLIMSSIISSVSTFFRTKELEFLFATPMNVNYLFIIKLIENGFYASWATSLISFPLIFSLGKVFNQGYLFYLNSVFYFILLVILATSIGLIAVFLFSKFFLKYSTGSLLMLLILIVIIFALLIFFNKSPDIFNLPQNASLYEINNYIKSLEIEQFKFFPSGFVSQIIFNSINKENYDINPYKYIFLYFIAIIPLIILSMSIYGKKYISNTIGVINKKSKTKNRLNYSFFNNSIFLLMKKDLIIFLRDPSQWGQSLIFLILLIFYVISLIRSPIYFKTPFFTYILAFANMGFSAYITATLSIRFIYPLISLEGKTFDIIKVYVNVNKFYIAKLLFNFIIIFILGEILVTGTNIFLTFDIFIIFISAIFIFIISIGITFINTGIGAIFPDFNETNPSKIASGFGGIISAIISLVYIGLTLSIMSAPTKLYFEYSFKGLDFNKIYFLIALLIITFITIIISIPLYLTALRKLKS